MSRSKPIYIAVIVLLMSACAVPEWVPPADHPADPGAKDGIKTSPTALKRYRKAAAAVERANASQPERKLDTANEEDSLHQHGDKGIRP